MSIGRDRVELLQGTLDLLILQALRLGPAHGHTIMQLIQQGSDDVLRVEQGSLYPALHRLIKRGWIGFEQGTSENNRRAKYYRLTPKGRKQLTIETSKWQTFARAIARLLKPAQSTSSTARLPHLPVKVVEDTQLITVRIRDPELAQVPRFVLHCLDNLRPG